MRWHLRAVDGDGDFLFDGIVENTRLLHAKLALFQNLILGVEDPPEELLFTDPLSGIRANCWDEDTVVTFRRHLK